MSRALFVSVSLSFQSFLSIVKYFDLGFDSRHVRHWASWVNNADFLEGSKCWPTLLNHSVVVIPMYDIPSSQGREYKFWFELDRNFTLQSEVCTNFKSWIHHLDLITKPVMNQSTKPLSKFLWFMTGLALRSRWCIQIWKLVHTSDWKFKFLSYSNRNFCTSFLVLLMRACHALVWQPHNGSLESASTLIFLRSVQYLSTLLNVWHIVNQSPSQSTLLYLKNFEMRGTPW